MMLTHPLEHRLVRYALGGTSEPVRRRIAEHLAACPDCRRIVQQTREARTRVAEGPAPAPPADFVASVLAARASGRRALLPVEEPAPPRRIAVPRRAVWWIAAGGAVAVAGVVAIPREAQPVRFDTPPERAPRVVHLRNTPSQRYFPAAAPMDGRRLKPMTLVYVDRRFLKGKLSRTDTSLILRIDREDATQEWRFISQYRIPGDTPPANRNRPPDTVWVDQRTLRPTRLVEIHEWPRHTIVLRSRFSGDSAYPAITMPDDLPEQIRRQYAPLDSPFPVDHGDGTPYVNALGPAWLMMAIPLAEGWRGRFSKWRSRTDWERDQLFEVLGSRRISTPGGAVDCWEVRQYWGTIRWYRKTDGVLVAWSYLNDYDPTPTGDFTETVLLSAS